MEFNASNRFAVKIGYWSAVVGTLLFLVFTICFLAVSVMNPVFKWTNLPAYIAFTNSYDQSFKNIAQFAMLLFAPAFIILLSTIHECARQENKILTRIGTYLAIAFAVCIGIHYFIQITTVRMSIAKDQVQGLEQFIQGNPISASAAINMLGWTLFLGLASLFVAPVFSANRLERVVRAAFLANGLVCLLGGIGFVVDNILIVFVTMNLGMGAALLVAMVALCILFRRMERAVVSQPLGRQMATAQSKPVGG